MLRFRLFCCTLGVKCKVSMLRLRFRFNIYSQYDRHTGKRLHIHSSEYMFICMYACFEVGMIGIKAKVCTFVHRNICSYVGMLMHTYMHAYIWIHTSMHSYIHYLQIYCTDRVACIYCVAAFVSSGNQVVHNLILNRNAVIHHEVVPLPLALVYDYQILR